MNAFRSNLLAICLGASLSVTAGAVVDLRDEGGGTHTVFFDDQKFKIEADDKTNRLIDLEQRSFLGVDASEQRVVDLSEAYKPATDDSNGEKVLNVQIEHLGVGPKMAHFELARYRASVNSTVCTEERLSRQTSWLADIATFLPTVVASSNTALDGSTQAELSNSAASLCASAEYLLNKELQAKYGIPLKLVSSMGEVTPEFTQIRGQDNIEAKVFEAPVAFARTTIQEMEKALDDAMSQIRGMPPAEHPG